MESSNSKGPTCSCDFSVSSGGLSDGKHHNDSQKHKDYVKAIGG